MENRQEGLILHSIVLILNFLNADHQETVEKDAKKESYTSSELNIIKSYLFRGGLTDYSPLHKRKNSSWKREGAHALHWHL